MSSAVWKGTELWWVCQHLSQLWPHKANERRKQCPAWPTPELSFSPNCPTGTVFTFLSNSQAAATTAAEGRWDQPPTWGISVPTELRETRWSQRIMWSKSLTLPWGRVSPVCCQQFLKSAQWEKLMALLMFPIALSHFLSSFARLLFSLPPEVLLGLQCTFALLKAITSSLAQCLKGLTYRAKLPAPGIISSEFLPTGLI